VFTDGKCDCVKVIFMIIRQECSSVFTDGKCDCVKVICV